MNFEEIINRIKKLKGLKTEGRSDKPIRIMLGYKTASALKMAKKQNSIPYEQIIKWGLREGYSLEYIFSGTGLPDDIATLWENANKQARQSAIDCLRAGQVEEKKDAKKNTG